MGIDLADPLSPRPFLYDTTGLVLTAKAAGANMNFSTALGPLGAFIVNGSAVVDGDCNPATPDDAATFTLGLIDDPSDHRYYFDDGLDTTIVSADLAGMACATLPVYFPTTSNFLGNIELEIGDLSDIPGSITLTAPDLNGQFDLLDLLDNLGIVITGLDTLLGKLQTGMSSEVFGKKLPLVGKQLQTGANFIADIRSGVLDELHDALDGAGSKSLTLVRQALFDALGPAGMDLLKDANADTTITIEDVVVATTEDSVLVRPPFGPRRRTTERAAGLRHRAGRPGPGGERRRPGRFGL